MPRLKICITIPNLHGAGCERMLSEILPYLASEYEIDLLLVENKINYVIPNEVNIICLQKTFNHQGLLKKIPSFLSVIFALIGIFRKNKYDRIISFLDMYSLMVMIANKASLRPSYHIACEQTTDYEFFEHSQLSRLKQFFYKRGLKIAYNNVNHIVAVSYNLKTFLQKELKIKTLISVIHNGFNRQQFNLLPPTNLQAIDVDFINSDTKIVCISRFHLQKNIPFLIDSFNLIKDKLPKANLFLMGTGPLIDEIKSQISYLGLDKRVFLLGFCANPQDYLKLSDIFVLTSLYESFGNVVIEALACGIPVVTTNYGNVLKEMITSKNLGQVVDTNDAAIFAHQLEAVIHNKYNYSKTSIANYALANFEVSLKADEYLQIIN